MWTRPSSSSGSKRLKSSQIPRPWRDAADRIGAGEQKEKAPHGAVANKQVSICKDMEKILKNEEIGRLAELAADYVRKSENRRVTLTFDRNYSGSKFLRVSVSKSSSWSELASGEYLLEPEVATAAEALSGILSEADGKSETVEESHE